MGGFLRGLLSALDKLSGAALVRLFADLLTVELDTAGGRLNQFWVKAAAVGALVVLVVSSLRVRFGDGAMFSWGQPACVVVVVLLIVAVSPAASAFLLYLARKHGIDLG